MADRVVVPPNNEFKHLACQTSLEAGVGFKSEFGDLSNPRPFSRGVTP
jgi:hypothetical protein